MKKKIKIWSLLIVVSFSFVLFTNVQQLRTSHLDPVCETHSLSSSNTFFSAKETFKITGCSTRCY
jgi:hypothetical protein